jgi:hypothetical protein
LTAINHAITGAAIALAVQQPMLVIPLALMSHFVLDTFPHFGLPAKDVGSKKFNVLLLSDAGLCFLLVLVMFALQPSGWLLVCIAAFIATSPDFIWVSDFASARRGITPSFDSNILKRFHSKIQTRQSIDGWRFELIWFLCVAGTIFVLT